jgi:hypothetical protein
VRSYSIKDVRTGTCKSVPLTTEVKSANGQNISFTYLTSDYDFELFKSYIPCRNLRNLVEFIGSFPENIQTLQAESCMAYIKINNGIMNNQNFILISIIPTKLVVSYIMLNCCSSKTLQLYFFHPAAHLF